MASRRVSDSRSRSGSPFEYVDEGFGQAKREAEMKKRLKREQRFGPCEGKSKSSSRDGDRRSDRRYELDSRKSDPRRRDII